MFLRVQALCRLGHQTPMVIKPTIPAASLVHWPVGATLCTTTARRSLDAKSTPRAFSTSPFLRAATTQANTQPKPKNGSNGSFIEGVVHPHAAEHDHEHDRHVQAETQKPGDAKAQPVAVERQGDWVLFHPVYTPDELRAVKVATMEAKTFGDKIAVLMVKFMRTIFDAATRYKHHAKLPPVKGSEPSKHRKVNLPHSTSASAEARETAASAAAHANAKTSGVDIKVRADVGGEDGMDLHEMRKKGLAFGPEQWLTRILFLESIAGCPGMVAATCRHLKSLRLMRRDGGWIHTMLEDAENERMHLLTFMTMSKPGLFMRTMIIAAQGVFYNFFMLFYLMSPRVAHRFVGVLEEEAVLTYTRLIREMEEGRLPEWEQYPAPRIAQDYWRLGPDAKLIDVIYAVRSDEATHRFINHTLANLDQKSDFNPFAIREPDAALRGSKAGLTREEAHEWALAAEREARHQATQAAQAAQGGQPTPKTGEKKA